MPFPLTHDLTVSCIGWVQTGDVWASRVLLFHVCPKSAVRLPWLACTVCRPFFWLFSGFPFFYGLPHLGPGPCLMVGFAFLQSTLFYATISCHITLSFLLRNCLPQSCWTSLGLLFILLLMAQYDHWFFYYITGGLLCPICFPLGVLGPDPFAFLRLLWPFS